MPIQLIFELVFNFAYNLTEQKAGLAIIALSLAINLLVLPLYRRADAMQEEERVMEAKLRPGVSHIKKTFRGDERTMMLQTYYRQNNYSPLYVLRSAVSLFLEIPFFIAAYRFLSGLSLLNGVAFGPIADLGKPDGLIFVGGINVNLLPILMTAINIVSTIVFTKNYPLKTKIQLYGMAAFFLVFLYSSPSGLVFYWTLNNLFSLVKTIFYKLKDPKKVIRYLMLVTGACSVAFGIFDYTRNALAERLIFFVCIGIALCVPFVLWLFKSKAGITLPEIKAEPNKKLFLCCTTFLAVITGILIPSAVIAASPQEFVILGEKLHPIWYVISSFLIASGLFILWFGVFYRLFSSKAKAVFERLILFMCLAGVVDYLFFGNNFGTLSAELVYNDSDVVYSVGQILLNTAILVAVAAAVIFVAKNLIKTTSAVIVIATLAMICMSVINAVGIYSSVAQIDEETLSSADDRPTITLSKTEKNVIVLMLDRAMGEYVPYIMSEHPELQEAFSGFTYYSNTVSFGGFTNFGVPALFGGYEYTPAEMNKRDTESLESKHNEALKVMPEIFDEAGYEVTVCDAPYAGYNWVSDMSIYDEYPDIKTYLTQQYPFADNTATISNRYRNFFCYSIMKTMPVCFQPALYDSGSYLAFSDGVSSSWFSKSYNVLRNLCGITDVTEQSSGSFIMMDNDTTHEPVFFKDEDYLSPSLIAGEAMKENSPTYNGIKLDMSTEDHIKHYQTNTATLMRLAEWMDELKKQGVYDNTRIILAADHGRGLQQIEELIIDDSAYSEVVERRYGDAEYYFPLLMVKDFGSEEFSISDEFMTNADVPTLAVSGLIDDAKNPFTGKTIDNSEKTAHDQLIIGSHIYSVSKNNGNTFLPARWYTVHDSIWNKDNWKIVAEDAVLTQ